MFRLWMYARCLSVKAILTVSGQLGVIEYFYGGYLPVILETRRVLRPGGELSSSRP